MWLIANNQYLCKLKNGCIQLCTRFVRSCPLRFFCSCSDFRQVIEYFGYWLEQFISPNNISMFYIRLHAVLPLLMLQIYRTGTTFIYIVRFVGDR